MPEMTLDQFLVKIGAKQFVRVVCGWCSVVILDGPPELPISHGMCPTCQETFGFELEADNENVA